ncbi:hypothetical protein [Mycobacterium tuberculosis]
MGRLVQPSPPLPVLRRRPAGRTRGCLLRSTPETSRRLRSQIRESPDSPGRFNYDHWAPAPEDGADVDVQAAEGADAEAAAMDEWDEWQAWNEWVAENAEPRFEVPRSSSSVIPHSPAAG